MHNPLTTSTPPNELYVVGEHTDNPDRLLLQGADGNFYRYELPEGDPQLVEVTDEWKVETQLGDEFLV